MPLPNPRRDLTEAQLKAKLSVNRHFRDVVYELYPSLGQWSSATDVTWRRAGKTQLVRDAYFGIHDDAPAIA